MAHPASPSAASHVVNQVVAAGKIAKAVTVRAAGDDRIMNRCKTAAGDAARFTGATTAIGRVAAERTIGDV